MAKIIVYTSIAGFKDNPRDDIKCFPPCDKLKYPVMAAKIYKILPHLYLDTEFSIWVDGNITLRMSPEEMVAKMTKDIMVFPNPYRDCLYQEGMYCAAANLDYPETILHQLEEYKKAGFPEKAGLAACGIIVRKHTKEIAELNEKWWAHICRYSNRDQISFPFVFGDKIQYLEKLPPPFKDTPYFKRVGHIK